MNRNYIENVINMGDKMVMDLTDIGIEEGQKYEGIYTTMSKDGVKNAAPILYAKARTNLDADYLSVPQP